MSDKKRDPAFLFYPADFLIGTMDMTDEEVGIYMRLLCRQHQKGNIAPTTKINGQLISDLSPEILSKFCKDNQGRYYNKRLKVEIDKRNKYVQSRRSNRLKKSQDEKHMKKTCKTHDDTHDNSYDVHMENENIYINNTINNIIVFLNSTCKTKYKPNSKKTISLIKARLKEGYTLEDFKTVITKKHAEWKGTEYEKFLRPETLFGTKFEGYLNQKDGSVKSKEADKLDSFYDMTSEWARGE